MVQEHRERNWSERIEKVTDVFQESKMLLSGVAVGVFDHLALGSATAVELATALGITARGAESLCDALAGFGYLHKDAGERYAIPPEVRPFLVDDGPQSMSHLLRFRNELFSHFARLDETLRGGLRVPEGESSVLNDVVKNRSFILGMAAASRERVGLVVDRVLACLPRDVQTRARPARIVDLGGGPAHYACEMARRLPSAEVLALDLPTTTEVAREYIAAAGMSERVQAVACDFYGGDPLEWGGQADLVFISQVIHAEGLAQNAALLARLAPHVREDGVVAVFENAVGEDGTAPAGNALFGLCLCAASERGRVYSTHEIVALLRAAGFALRSAEEVVDRSWLVVASKATEQGSRC